MPKIRAEIIEIEARKTKEIINKTESCFFLKRSAKLTHI